MALKDDIEARLARETAQPGRLTVFQFRKHQKEILEALDAGATIKLIWDELVRQQKFSGSYVWFTQLIRKVREEDRGPLPSSGAKPTSSTRNAASNQNTTHQRRHLHHSAKPDTDKLL